MSFLENIFSVKNEGIHKVWNIFGIKIKYLNIKTIIYTLLTQNNKLSRENTDIKNSVKNIRSEVGNTNQKIENISQNVKNTNLKINEIHEISGINESYYNSNFERKFLVPFYEYMERKDFREKYLRLIKNLSENDIQTINKILSRINLIKTNPKDKKLNLFNDKEILERKNLINDIRKRTLKIDDEMYVYNNYRLPINHFEICVFCYRHGIDLIEDLTNVRNKNIIDAGAFIGDSALVLSKYTDNKIYSFEATPANYNLMEKTIQMNNLTKVVPIQKALYSSNCELSFNVSGSASSKGKQSGVNYNQVIEVQAITLDEFVRENKLEVGLIKTDLEGSEIEFIKGALDTIKTQKPALLFSMYHLPKDFFEIKPMIEDLNLGYEFKIFNPTDMSIELETMLIAEVKNR